MFSKSFYDKNGNFNNELFVKLLEKARKEKIKKQKMKWRKFQNKEINLFKSVSRKELWKFVNKLSIFMNSWIDIKWALWILIKQTKNPFMRDIIIEMRTNIDHWISLNETMSQYPKVFDSLTTSLIDVWEKTWQLWVILDELDKNILENIEIKWKVKWAMIYPTILLFLTAIMVVFMMVFIVPKITATFEKANVELPALTQFVVNVSNFLKNDYITFIVIIITFILFIKILNTTYFWKILFATIAIKIPIFWFVVRQSNIIYFIKSFTLLQNAWVLLLDSLKISSKVVPNLLYKKELIRVKNEVEVGLTISKALWLNLEYESNVYLNQLFPEEFAYVVSTWEETWSLSNSLWKVWANYNNELKRYIWNLSTMMEPIIIVTVWFLVWTIVIAIMLPFFKMWEVAKSL